jgi:hypothetical protein
MDGDKATTSDVCFDCWRHALEQIRSLAVDFELAGRSNKINSDLFGSAQSDLEKAVALLRKVVAGRYSLVEIYEFTKDFPEE